MKFFLTPYQRKVLSKYWTDHKPFTLDTLWEDGLLKNIRWDVFQLKRMLRKSQIIGFRDTDGQIKFVGTTEDKAEFEWIRSTKINPLFDITLSSAFWTAGMNKYELQKSKNEMTEIIEKKKKEIRQRQEKST